MAQPPSHLRLKFGTAWTMVALVTRRAFGLSTTTRRSARLPNEASGARPPPRRLGPWEWESATREGDGAAGRRTVTSGDFNFYSSSASLVERPSNSKDPTRKACVARRTVTSGDFNFYPSSASLADPSSSVSAGLAGSIAAFPSLDPDLWGLFSYRSYQMPKYSYSTSSALRTSEYTSLPADPFGARFNKARPRKLLDQSGLGPVKIDLTREEEELFELLRTVTTESGMKTTLRVAGGWVRDKILASNEFQQFQRDTVGVCFDNLCGLDDLDPPELAKRSLTTSDRKALAVTVPVDIDIALDDKLGREFADELNDWLSTHGRETHSVGLVQKNPEKSKHLETATMQVNNYWIDFVNLRAEEYASDSRIPELMRIGTPLEDALRRDLTINSLFYNVNTGEVEDMTGRGLNDLRKGIVATPLPPLTTLLDDPLRVLRSVRFAARLGFGMEESLRRACADGRVRTALGQKVSRERVGGEVDLMLKGCDPVRAMRLLVNLGLVETVLPLPQTEIASSGGSNNLDDQGGSFASVYRKGLALLGAAHDYLCGNRANAPSWCDAERALEAGAVNGASKEDTRVLMEDERARRLLWYAAFLKPLRDCTVPTDKRAELEMRKRPRKAKRSVVLRLLADEMKRPTQEAEAVEKIMRAADGFTRLISDGGEVSANLVLLSGARVSNAHADGSPGASSIVCTMGSMPLSLAGEEDPVWRHCMEFRQGCADVLREIGPLWRAAFVLSLCERARASRTEVRDAVHALGGEPPGEAVGSVFRGYDLFAAAMMQLGLVGVWNRRPLLDGNEVRRLVLPNVPGGPAFRDVMDAQTRWMTGHPGGGREELAEHLREAFPDFQ